MLQYCFFFMFWFLGCKAYGILAHWPGIEPTPPVLEGKVLANGLPGKSWPRELNSVWLLIDVLSVKSLICNLPTLSVCCQKWTLLFPRSPIVMPLTLAMSTTFRAKSLRDASKDSDSWALAPEIRVSWMSDKTGLEVWRLNSLAISQCLWTSPFPKCCTHCLNI